MISKFKDIVGYEEEKEELINICNIINNRKELVKYGCKIPKGLFIVGPNGVGKTMMANLLIENIACNVIKIEENDYDTESDFKSYIKEKFSETCKEEFSIVYIDEIDKMIGNDYDNSLNDNFEKSNVLLNEINKYIDKDNIFLLLVGNDELRIGRSLLRSGRVDKVISVNLPNNNEREKIIRDYISDKNFSKELDIDEIVSLTKHRNCATIKCVLNESLIKAYIKNKKEVTQEDVREALFNNINVRKDKSINLDKKSLSRLATHEVSHAVVLIKLGEKEVSKISILGNGDIGGYVMCNETDRKLYTLKNEEDRIAISLAGYVGEKLYFGNVGVGSIRDLSFAKDKARDLVRNQAYFGFDKLSSNDMSFENNPKISNRKLTKMEKCEEKLLKINAKKAKKILRKNKKLVDLLIEELVEKKVLYKEEIYRLCK